MGYPVDELQNRLKLVADLEDAPIMKKYMKDQFEFLGVKSTPRKKVLRDFVNEHGLPDRSELEQSVRNAWYTEYREVVYCMIEIVERTKRIWDREVIEVLEWMVVNQSWWDTVDGIASRLMGTYFKKFPEETNRLTGDWIDSDNLWLRRTALLFQLKYKQNTDTDILANYIQRTSHEKEFFIRKAIGWVLREYSKTNPEWVREFIQSNDLQPLSVKEGSKYL